MERLASNLRNASPEKIKTLVGTRIRYDLQFYREALPREVAISWSGYIQSVGEWSPAADPTLIADLRRLLPPIDDDPHGDDSIDFPTDTTMREHRRTISPEAVDTNVVRRITDDRRRFGQTLPRELAVYWSGYIQALGEWCPASWDLIADLRAMLPEIPDDPSQADNGQYLPL